MIVNHSARTVFFAVLLVVESSLAFSTTKLAKSVGPTISDTRRFMSEESEGDWIKTVNSKEIFFDERKGRFFETKKEYEEGEKPSEVSGPFPANPFKKPAGTFFEELGKKDETLNVPTKSVSTSVTSEDPSKETVVPGFSLEKKLFDNIFKSSDDESTSVEPVKVSVPTPSPVKENQGFNFFGELFKSKSESTSVEEAEPVVYYDPVTISNDFRVAGAFLAGGLLLDQIPYIQILLGLPATLLGLLFLVQSFRIRFVFNEKNELELVNVKNILTGETESSGENVVVGGANVWSCDTIV